MEQYTYPATPTAIGTRGVLVPQALPTERAVTVREVYAPAGMPTAEARQLTQVHPAQAPAPAGVPAWAKGVAVTSAGLGVLSLGVGAGGAMLATAGPGLLTAAKALALGLGSLAGFVLLAGIAIAYTKKALTGGDTYNVTHNTTNHVSMNARWFGRNHTEL